MKRVAYPLVFLIFLPLSHISAQPDLTDSYSASDTISDFGLFTSDEIFEISLRFDVTHYKKKKPKEEYMDAILTYHISKTDSINRNIRLRSRGEFRNGYCDFPPLYLNFKKAGLQKEDLKKIEKMKLVTHCQSGNEKIVYKEYLCYKLYNVLTDTSFRVRLIKINYINTYKKSKPLSSYAFFIEPLDLLADRIGTIPVELTKLGQNNINQFMMDRVAIFNYMIGNTDWSVPNQHNVRVFVDKRPTASNLGLIVPYDFDYSGLVNASYAVPAEGLGIESVRQRLYLGLCRSKEVFTKDLEEFVAKKEAFYKVINDFTLLDEKSRKDMIKFLDEFFSSIERKNSILYYLMNECKD